MTSGGQSTPAASGASLNSSAKAHRTIEEASRVPLVRLLIAVGCLFRSDAAVGYCRAFTGGMGFTHSTSRSTTRSKARWSFGSGGGSPRRSRTDCRMAVTPIGPFCPFRSDAAVQLDPKMSRLNTATPDFATDMARIQLDMETGKMPEPSKLISVATSMEEAVDEWEDLLTRLRLSDDFQTREYSKLTQAHLERHGQSTEGIGKMMRWQSACMRAMATNSPPPPPPSDLNLMEMVSRAREQQEGGGDAAEAKPPPSMSAMASASYITSTPFKGTEAAFDSPTVREEYERLCRDHAALIDMGGGYAKFDPAGKIAFLDEIEKVEERWDVFFARFSLLGALDKQFSEECDAFLEGLGLDEPDFRDLLRRAHALMREDAERERNMNYS